MNTSPQTNRDHGSTSLSIRPEFIPLPQRGADPIFGLGRSSYYDLERRGIIQLVRIRKPGQVRGRVLIPVDAVRRELTRLSSMANRKLANDVISSVQ